MVLIWQAVVPLACGSLALTLAGCGATVDITPPPDPLTVRYLEIKDFNEIEANMPDCNFITKDDIGKKVDAKCCDKSKWPEDMVFAEITDNRQKFDSNGEGEAWLCYSKESTTSDKYTRNFFNCVDGAPCLRENCKPKDDNGDDLPWPMDKADADKSFENGSPDTCNCDLPDFKGPGCFVASTSRLVAGVTQDLHAKFVTLSGDCPSEDVTYF